MRLTPTVLIQAYELLRTTPPFKRWKLPHADDVEFRLVKQAAKGGRGDYFFDGETHIIRLVPSEHPDLTEVLATIAHELCHMRQTLTTPSAVDHGPIFRHLAAQVCRAHRWDLETF